MKVYKNKIKRDIVGSPNNYGVYIKAVKSYKKGEEIFIGSIKSSDRERFDLIIKKIK